VVCSTGLTHATVASHLPPIWSRGFIAASLGTLSSEAVQPDTIWRRGFVRAGLARALKELGPWFGLEGTDSVSNLARLGETRHNESSKWRRQAKQIEIELGLNTGHKA